MESFEIPRSPKKSTVQHMLPSACRRWKMNSTDSTSGWYYLGPDVPAATPPEGGSVAESWSSFWSKMFLTQGKWKGQRLSLPRHNFQTFGEPLGQTILKETRKV